MTQNIIKIDLCLIKTMIVHFLYITLNTSMLLKKNREKEQRGKKVITLAS